MIKTIKAHILCACLALFCMNVYVAAEEKKDTYNLTIPEIQAISKRGKLIVLMISSDYNPLFNMKDKNGEYKGVDIDMAQSIADALGVKLEIKRDYKTYDDVIDGVAKGEGDIGISKLSYTVDRSKKVLFTSPYVIFKKSLLINRISLSKIDNRLQLNEIMNASRTPIVTAPGSYDDFARALFPKASTEEHKKWDTDGISGVLSGKYFAAFRDELRIRLVLRENPQATLHLLPVVLKDEEDPIHMVVHKESFGLLIWINSFMSNNVKPYSIDELFEKYGKFLKSK